MAKGQTDSNAHGTAPTATPWWLGYAAAAASLVLAAAHGTVTTGTVIRGQEAATPLSLVWTIVPVLVCAGFAAVAVALVRRPVPSRGLVALSGLWAVLAWFLAVAGLLPILVEPTPERFLSLFAGPGPYALPTALLYTALTWRSVRGRR